MARVPRAPRHAVAEDADELCAAFLASIAHAARHPCAREWDPVGQWQRLQLPNVNPDCGWWWCGCNRPLGVDGWKDLAAAVRILRKHKIDPSAAPAARLAWLWTWRYGHQDQARELRRVPPERLTAAEAQNTKLFREEQQNGDGRPADLVPDDVARVCDDRGWGADERIEIVAAHLMLFGVDRRPLDDIRKWLGRTRLNVQLEPKKHALSQVQ